MPNLEEIGLEGFSNCENLVKLILPKLKIVGLGYHDHNSYIISNGFSSCNSLTEIDLPSLEETSGF